MKKTFISALTAALVAGAISCKAPKDPVVMKVAGQDVRLSEFEYLYNKNNSQQIEPMTFDEYVELFTNYKMKVADARAAGIDTTARFKQEFGRYRRDLARPYLKDKATEEALVQEAYSHTLEDVYVSHIMIDLRNPNAQAIADSLYTAITTGAITYEEAAIQNSIDKASGQRGGKMGWVTGEGHYPWAFEKAAYDTPVGEVSRPINSGFGLHLVRPEIRRPAKGMVHTRHILLTTANIDSALYARRKNLIDSIYNVAVNGGDFAELAQQYSQDTGTRANGGDLGWYGPGRMVEPFDSISFAMADGTISEPFESPYGFHIIQKIESRKALPLDSLRPAIEEAIASDDRANQAARVLIDRVAQANDARMVDDYKNPIREYVRSRGGMTDSLTLVYIREMQLPAYYINGKPVSVASVVEGKMLLLNAPHNIINNQIEEYAKEAFDHDITEIEISRLEVEDPEFRNIINEYRDGILLFDIANKRVWERASKDKEGLENYFRENRAKYCTWTAPKYRAYVIFTTDSATCDEVVAHIDSLYPSATMASLDQEKFTQDIRDTFRGKVKIERVIASKGENPFTDYLGFGSETPPPLGSNWKCYFAVAGELIEQPVEALDVKGLVTTDYQNALEQEWIDELRQKYPVEINTREIRKANK